MSAAGEPVVRELHDADRAGVRALVAEHFGSSRVVSRGLLHDADALPGFVALRVSSLAGVLLYRLEAPTSGRPARSCEVVVLIAAQARRGVGGLLIGHAVRWASERAVRRLWLVTTNDNTPAMRFYEAQGWRRATVHANAVAAARLLKPEIPLLGIAGEPIRDEIEYELASQLFRRERDSIRYCAAPV